MSDPVRTRLETSLSDRYAVERELDGGGMSRVFVATERTLGRKVVIKVLSSERSAGLSVRRFEREIRMAASLQQANIVPVLAAGELDGLPYYTMPFIDGLSLRERLQREAPVAFTEAISVLRDVARALAYAHEHGVVHRDIKPGNILLSGDAAVVTDFGLARAISAARGEDDRAAGRDTTVTEAGVAMGTPAYMAPEQISGDPSIDQRADLYAFGCLAYELLAGAPPFRATSAQALFAAHLAEKPEPLVDRNPDVPPGLAQVIDDCLAKDPAQRPASARAILTVLEEVSVPASGLTRLYGRLAGRRQRVAFGTVVAAGIILAATLLRGWPGAAGVPLSSIAVIPFSNASRDSADEYLVDGIADGVATALGRIGGVRVVARTLSAQFRGQRELDPGAVGRALAADYFILGSVARVGGRIIISAQLTRTHDSTEVWSDHYDRAVIEAQAIGSDLSRAVAARLGLATGEVQHPTDPQAYDWYMRGRFQLQRRSGGVRQATVNFDSAIATDPNFAAAHAGRAFAQELLPYFEPVNAESIGVPAVESASRALAMDSTLADAHLALALAAQHRYRWSDAEASYRRALAADLDNADAHIQYGRFLFYTGRSSEALPEFERARALDPRSAVASGWVGHLLELSGRPTDGIAELRRALEIDSTNPPALVMMSQAQLQVGRLVDSRRYVDLLARVWPQWGGAVAAGLAQLGDDQAARAIVRRLEERGPQIQLVAAYAALGDSTALFATLEALSARHAIWPTYISLSERIFDFARRSDRFREILRSVGLDERAFTSPTGGRER